jgi:hypothetical protein
MNTAILMALLAVCLGADEKSSARRNTLSFDPAKGSPEATLADAAWLAGRWIGTGLGGQSEEVWLPAQGGAMLSTFREINGNRIVFKHFHPDLKGWEDRDTVRNFPLVRATSTELFFDDLTYRKISDREMEAFVLIRKKSGEVVEERFPMRRASKF